MYIYIYIYVCVCVNVNVYVNVVYIISGQPGPTIWDSPVAGRTIPWADHGGTSQPFQPTHIEHVNVDHFRHSHGDIM